MSTIYKDELREVVSRAQKAQDLLPIIKQLDIDKFKDFINCNINEMAQLSARKMYFNALSIDLVIPGDITQHIISFQLVSKTWNKLSKQAAKNHYLNKGNCNEESLGFGSFGGFDLDDMSEQEEGIDDDREVSGKTYQRKKSIQSSMVLDRISIIDEVITNV